MEGQNSPMWLQTPVLNKEAQRRLKFENISEHQTVVRTLLT